MKVRSDQLKNAIILVAFGVILLWVLDNLNALWGVLLMLFSLVSPFIIGIVIAFIMNVPMRYFERTLLKQLPHKLKRATSYLITLIIILLIIFITLIIVVPELTSSVQEIAHRTPQAWNNFLNWLERTNIIENEYVGEFVKNISLDWPKIEQKAISLLSARASNWIVSTFNVATSLIGAIASLLIGYVFSIYVLLQKEKLLCQTKKISIALFPKKIHRKLSYLSDLTNTTFSNFLSGQLLEAIIVGVMFFIAMKIFRFPYALVVSLLTGISSFIPVIGPIIGAIIGALLIMVHDVSMAFWFIIMSIAIQQLEGNLIYPNVAGKAVGLPAIWVLVAITIGGSLFGVIGIILFVPLGTIVYILIKEFVNNRLRAKNISREDIDEY
jgi:predicted PurR-regulated permease PerM